MDTDVVGEAVEERGWRAELSGAAGPSVCESGAGG